MGRRRRKQPQNPFRYGAIVRSDQFADRDAELADLESDIRNGQNVLIVSPRRFGKTSLVVRAIDELRAEGVLVAYLDLFRAPTKERFADHLAQAIYGGLVAPLERAIRQAATFFAHLPIAPRITVTDDGRPAVEFTTFETRPDVDRTVETLLAMPGKIARERKRRVAIVFDEFQEVLSIDPDLPGVMRSVFQEQDEVAHVFLGSRRHLMEQLFHDRDKHLYRAAKPLTLGPIAPDEWAPFVARRFARSGVSITREAIDEILDLTGGQPYDTQELCYFTWALARAEGVEATPKVVRRALEQILEAESARYTTIMDELSPRQRALLVALALETGEVFSEEYRRRHKLGSASSVGSALDRLVARDLVASSGKRHHVADVFLRAWLVRSGRPEHEAPD